MMKKTKSYLSYLYMAALSVIIIYGLVVLIGGENMIKPVTDTVIEDKVYTITESEIIILEKGLEGWGPV